MATSKPSQPTLFEAGESEPRARVLPTPNATDGTCGAVMNENTKFIRSPSGNIRKLSNAGEDYGLTLPRAVEMGAVSTSSPGVIPASHFHSPGSDWARRMTAISGQKCAGWSTLSGQPGYSLKMLLATSRWASTLFYLTWRRTATPAGRSLYRLVPSTPSTGATGFGSWPTPLSTDHKLNDSPGAWNKNTPQLGTVVHRSWPTPRHEGFDAGGHRGTTDSLHSAVKAFPTPVADDSNHRNATEKDRVEAGRQVMLRHMSEPGQKLHGRWTLKLMGFPPDWCDDLPPDPLDPT